MWEFFSRPMLTLEQQIMMEGLVSHMRGAVVQWSDHHNSVYINLMIDSFFHSDWFINCSCRTWCLCCWRLVVQNLHLGELCQEEGAVGRPGTGAARRWSSHNLDLLSSS